MGPRGPADPPPAGSAGRSGEGQLRAPSTAAGKAAKAGKKGTAAFGASATADAARRKAYRNMTQIIADALSHVEWFSAGPDRTTDRIHTAITHVRRLPSQDARCHHPLWGHRHGLSPGHPHGARPRHGARHHRPRAGGFRRALFESAVVAVVAPVPAPRAARRRR